MNSILDMALMKNSVLVKLDLKSWGIVRKAKLPKGVVEKLVEGPALANLPLETPEEKEARLKKAEKMLGLSKDLIISPEYELVKQFQSAAKNRFIERYCNPSFIDDGLFSIKREVVMPDGTKKDLLKEALEELRLAKEELEKTMVPKLLKAYPAEVAEAAGVLNGQFNPKDYPGIVLQNGVPVFDKPEALAQKFDIRWRVTQLTVPEGLPPEIREEEEKKLRASFAAAERKITETLYTGFAEMVDKIVDRMKEGEDGKKKIFQYTTLQNLMEYIRNFRNKNVFNDARLTEMVAKAEDILSTIGTDPNTMAKRLRDYQGLKDRTEASFAALKAEVDKAVTELPTRSFDFDEV